MLPFSQDFIKFIQSKCRQEPHQVQVPAKNGYGKASVQWLPNGRLSVNHIFCSSKPHISIRVTALHSFVLLACKVVSVFSRMPSLSSDGGDQWPTTGSVFFYGIMLSENFTSLPATQREDASCNGVMPLLTADFFGYLQASFRDCMHSFLWRAHKTLGAVCNISQLPTGFFATDCLDE